MKNYHYHNKGSDLNNYHYHSKGSDPKGLRKLHPHPSVFVGKVKERSRVGQQLSGVAGLASAREVHRGGSQRCGSFTWKFEMSHYPLSSPKVSSIRTRYVSSAIQVCSIKILTEYYANTFQLLE